MNKLKAYTVIDKDADRSANAVLVFAEDEAGALQVAGQTFDFHERQDRATIRRAHDADKYADRAMARPYECDDNEACAAAGLIPDGWGECDACGDPTPRTSSTNEYCHVCEVCAEEYDAEPVA